MKKKDLLNNTMINLGIGPTEKQITEKMEELQKSFQSEKIRKIKVEEIGQNGVKKLNQRIEKTIIEMNQRNIEDEKEIKDK